MNCKFCEAELPEGVTKAIKGKTIYAILNPDILDNMQEELKAKITTVLKEKPEDFIIAKIHLK